MHLLSCVLKRTATDSSFNPQASCSKCPPTAWMHFLTRVTRDLVTLRSTVVVMMLLAAMRIRWSSSSLVFTCVGLVGEKICYESYCMGVRINPTP